ncbi:MAG: cell division protein ZapA [Pseudomonadota bacterium]
MPEVQITIGGRTFEVACQDGEEHFLHAAARLLDVEATSLIGQIGRMPEARMLLMAGLMLADKTAGLEDQVRAAEDRARLAERVAADAQARLARGGGGGVSEGLLALVAEAEQLADRIDARARA